MTGSHVFVGDDALEALLSIRMDGFVTGYASAVLTMALGGGIPRDQAESIADSEAVTAAEQIEADQIMLEAQRQQIVERLTGQDTGTYSINPVAGGDPT